jgi:ABC-type dipeptide/oligopeptide/nickel transport system permease subunit
MSKEIREYLKTSKPYFSALIGGIIGALFGSLTNNWMALLFGQFLGAIVAVLLAKPKGYILSGCVGSLSALLADLLMIFVFGGPSGTPAVIAMIVGVIIIGFAGGVVANYCRTSHTIINVFHSPRFVVGFTLICIIVMTAVFYPMIDTRNPMYSYGDMFLKPGTYFSIYDANIAAYNTTTSHRVKIPDATAIRQENFLPESQLEIIGSYLARKWAWENGYTVYSDNYESANEKWNISKGQARDLEQDRKIAIDTDQEAIAAAETDIELKQAAIEADPSRKDINERLIASRQKTIDEANAHIEAINKLYDSGKVIVETDAVRLWEDATGIKANATHRAELLQLWTDNYDAVMAAQTGEELAALVKEEAAPEGGEESAEDEEQEPAEEETEPVPTLKERYAAFTNGKAFILGETGLRYGSSADNTFQRITRAKNIDPEGTMSYVQKNSTAGVDPIEQDVTLEAFTSVSEVANTVNFPLGTDNNGRDMLLLLISAVGKSLLIGLLAGSIATLLGLLVGLLAGYVGGIVDDILTFIMNIFTVIPGFVLMIIIYNMVDKSQRGIVMCGTIIGVTSWVWTARSVRSQVISLRNRDHVNLSKLSGHSLFRIILTDILPYIASYVVMAFILQVSSGILAEAQLSILGLGPSMTDGSTLGLMMNWAKLFGAYTSSNAWWAYFPVIGTIALISFSLNLMNTGLDQVFNPTLRD